MHAVRLLLQTFTSWVNVSSREKPIPFIFRLYLGVFPFATPFLLMAILRDQIIQSCFRFWILETVSVGQ